jgi:multidrug efflux system membrane fusion protein
MRQRGRLTHDTHNFGDEMTAPSRMPFGGSRFIAAGTSGLLLLASLTACAGSADAKVVTVAASARTLRIAPAGTGSVVASIDKSILVDRRASVISVGVVDGQAVTRGQPLMDVYTLGPSQAVTQAVNQLQVDQLQYTSARARYGSSSAVTLEFGDKIVRDRELLFKLKGSPTTLRAPVAGRVSGLSVKSGDALTKTDVILHVVDDRMIRIVAQVAATYRSRLAVGQRAELTLPGLRPGATYTSTVVEIGPTATGDSYTDPTIPVTVELPNTAAIPLQSKAYVKFAIDAAVPVAVDSLAVLGVQQQPFVFVVDNGRVHQRPVVVGVSDGTSTEIIRGLSAGEDVVITGGKQLVDGAHVSASRWTAPS